MNDETEKKSAKNKFHCISLFTKMKFEDLSMSLDKMTHKSIIDHSLQIIPLTLSTPISSGKTEFLN